MGATSFFVAELEVVAVVEEGMPSIPRRLARAFGMEAVLPVFVLACACVAMIILSLRSVLLHLLG